MSSLEKVDRYDWQSSAACAGEMGSFFYPPLRPERKAARARREHRAKAVCASCPVREECLEQAVSRNERYGIWGGLTNEERQLAAEPVA